jgi:hypothetical protein
MIHREDIRSSFYLDSFLEGPTIPAKVAHRLVSANVGIVSVGDVQRRTISELRKAMADANIPKRQQDTFLTQLRASKVFPAGIRSQQEFSLT